MTLTNSTFTNTQIQVLFSDLSTFTMDGVNIYNVSSQYSIIIARSSTLITIKNLNITYSKSTVYPALITFEDSSANEISNSSFTNIQYYIFEFIRSQVSSFQNNILNGINKGMHFIENSNATISNWTFSNFKQNIESGGVYKSEIKGDGSGISKELVW